MMDRPVTAELRGNRLCLYFHGRIDSVSAPEVEKLCLEEIVKNPGAEVQIDASELSYISSAGLRVILGLRKKHPELEVAEVSPDVYSVFEMTGFTEILTVKKAFRSVSLEGCSLIAKGANGAVYRMDAETILKIPFSEDALQSINRERELARKAFVMGIPTAISYDIVKISETGQYGAVFELLDTTSLASVLSAQPERFEEVARLFTDLLKTLHSTAAPHGSLPDAKDTAFRWAADLNAILEKPALEKLTRLIQEVPVEDHLIHGDYHARNVLFQNGEVLLIDMDTLVTGNPVFELASTFNAYVGFSARDPKIIEGFQGIGHDTGLRFWHRFLELYFETDDRTFLQSAEDKAALLGYTRLLRRSTRRLQTEPDAEKDMIFFRSKLLTLLERTDSLVFGTPAG